MSVDKEQTSKDAGCDARLIKNLESFANTPSNAIPFHLNAVALLRFTTRITKN